MKDELSAPKKKIPSSYRTPALHINNLVMHSILLHITLGGKQTH
jgi:hypothetical protein